MRLPQRSVPSQPLRDSALAETRHLHRGDTQLPHRSPPQKNAVIERRRRLVVFLPSVERFCDVPPRVDVNLGCAARCGSVQRRHHGDRRSHQRRPERREGRPRHRRHCRILLRKSAHSRCAKNIGQCAAA